MSDENQPGWTNPIPLINLEGLPARLARGKQCAIEPGIMCSAFDCMSWMIVKDAPTPADQQGNCAHTLYKSVEMQARIRQQLEAAMREQRRAEGTLLLQQGQGVEVLGSKTN